MRGLLNRLEASDVLEQISIVIMLAGLLLFGATFANGASLDDVLAKRKAEATIDLATKDGVKLVKGEWRYSDTRIIEVDLNAAGADGQPGSEPNKASDFTPHAGGAGFDY